MEIYLLLLILSIVQSLFGVGILLFGTPLLLTMGVPYQEALLYLLPASAALSWSQVQEYKSVRLNGGYRWRFFLFCLPALFIGMLLTRDLDLKWEIRLFVTIMLFVAFVLRTSSVLREKLQQVMSTRLNWALTTMGLIHGLSNMGGAVLTPLVSSLYRNKKKVLAGISYDYAFMASFQLLVLLFVNGHRFEARFLTGAVISLSVRYLIGRRIFAFTTDRIYQRLINGLILASAVTLGINL